MSSKSQPNQKHMNQEVRVIIEKGLDSSHTLSSIATELCKKLYRCVMVKAVKYKTEFAKNY